MLDIKNFKKEFPQTLDKFELIPHFFYLLMSKYPFLAITKNDFLIHYSADTLKKYLNKIRCRLKNNIYHKINMGASGFSGRDKFQPRLFRLKKYLFIPYAFSIILPFVDAFYLAFTRRKIAYFLHVPLTIFTASLILFHLLLKMFGYSPQFRSYDESKILSKLQ